MDVDQMMAKMGFPATETGPYVTKLRARVARQISEGMMNRSGGTWADECYERDETGFIIGWKISAEERAKAILAMDWAVENGRSYRTEVLDPIIYRTFNTKMMRRGIRIRWHAIRPWIGDRARELAVRWRILTDRRVNPYE